MYALCPPAHLLEHTLSRIELGTVRQLYYRRQSHTSHQLTAVTTCPLSHTNASVVSSD